MPTDHRAELARIKRFDQLLAYLRDKLSWPIDGGDFEELTFEYTPEELGIDLKNAAKIQEIKRLRPLAPKQPWGIFFVKFEPKRLPVVALRRILSQVALKKRASANKSERQAWAADDLLFVSNYGEGDERQISFAHFSKAADGHDLPTLKVLGWDNLDTALHLDAVARELTENLAWPVDDADVEAWRQRWRGAFTLGHREVITTSKELSIRLAELARAIRDRIKTALSIETERGPLTKLMKAFQGALVHDLDADGFADMYAQTIAYGLLSARIADPHKKTADDFAAHMRTSPFLRELMGTFLHVGGRRGRSGGPGIDFDELGVSDVVELLDAANMEAVVRDFGDKNRQEDPVVHFYELFLSAYNKQLKIQRGVFYTPQPVVSYIVRSVHELLQTEFGLTDGLADTTTWGEMAKKHSGLNLPPLTDEVGEKRTISPNEPFVQILDPATGTATFLVEVVDVIHATLTGKWKQQRLTDAQQRDAWNHYVPQHLLPRLHAFELMMAPYAIAHMKIGLKLAETGYRFGSEERARIYLTNAIEPSVKQLPLIGFDALAHEAAEVNEIKRHKRFTVVIGNPPYSGESANNIPWVRDLVKSRYEYIEGKKIEEKGKKNWLLNDYVKFMRLAHFVAEHCQLAVIGLITPHSFFDNPTFRAMRYALIKDFQLLFLLDLHGNYDKREKCPDGSKDENVFDITQGVSISVFLRNTFPDTAAESKGKAYLSELWGLRDSIKYPWLLKNTCRSHQSLRVQPDEKFYFFRHGGARDDEYERWWPLNRIFQVNGNGVITAHDHFSIAFDDDELSERLDTYINTRLTDAQVLERLKLRENSMWKIGDARASLRRARSENRFVDVLYRPFDVRRTFFHKSVVFNLRLPVMKHMVAGGNVAVICSRMTKGETFAHAFVSRTISEAILLSSKTSNNAFSFPTNLKIGDGEDELFRNSQDSFQSNIAPAFLNELSGPLSPDGGNRPVLHSGEVFNYLYALLHSPNYRSRYAEFLKIDFPRLPLTGNLKLFHALARFGGELVALHLLESPKLDRSISEFIGGRNSEIEKVSWSKNTVWVDKAQITGFKGVREDVWNFHIGGYQVCEKWLKDRKGRKLLKADIVHYEKIVVALSETIRLMTEIDEIIGNHGGWPAAFQTREGKAASEKVIPFRPRTVEPKPDERYITCVPLVPLKAAAGAFGDPQHITDDGFEWVAVESRHRLRPGMFVAQVVGRSMEPAIPDGSWCLFRAPVEGTRQGKTVLVQLRDATDPETGQRFTIKRYESEKAQEGDSWRHAQITLKPINPDFKPIVLTREDEGELQVIAEMIEVLRGGVIT